jgi:hypothetical protein
MKKFKSDGCSFFFNGNWKKCCIEHDKKYWKGGTRTERKKADIELMKCVLLNGHPFIAFIMYVGVRIGGLSILPTPFRWGFGYNWPFSKSEDKDI